MGNCKLAGLGVLLMLAVGAAVLAAPDVAGLALLDQLALVDQDGRAVTSSRTQGRVVLLNFMFAECAASCPLQTTQLAAVQAGISPSVLPQVLFLSVSVDPTHDTPSTLKRFSLERGADLKHWAFVTGDASDIQRFAAALGAFDGRGASSPPGMHTTDLRLFDGHGRMMQRYVGAPVDTARLRREIEMLASPRIGLRDVQSSSVK